MQLLPCNRPSGPLESAPRTSLRADSAQERWEGYWCEGDEGYYARCVRTDGTEGWYRVADEDVIGSIPVHRALTPGAPRACHLRWSKLGARSILVGTSRRRAARSAR
ncbi:MAG: hypothetical protein WD801_08795 [Gemmatimonadaceae bacterium]